MGVTKARFVNFAVGWHFHVYKKCTVSSVELLSYLGGVIAALLRRNLSNMQWYQKGAFYLDRPKQKYRMEDIGLASAPTHGAVTLRGRSLLSFHHSPQSSHGPTELRTSPAIQPRPQKLPSRGVPAATGRLPPTTGPVPTTPRTVPTTPRTVPTPRTSVWQPAIPATTHRRCCYKSTTGRGRHRKLPQLQGRCTRGPFHKRGLT